MNRTRKKIKNFGSWMESRKFSQLEKEINAIKARKEKWFKSPTIIVSVIALIFSISSTSYVVYIGKEENIRNRRSELRELLKEIVNIKQSAIDSQIKLFANNDTSSKQYLLQNNYLTTLNEKRFLYLHSADLLATEIHDRVVPSEFLLLAEEWKSTFDYVKALKYYQNAVDQSVDTYTKLTMLRSLASFLYEGHQMQNIDEGRQYFKKAVSVLDGKTSAREIYTQGTTYKFWGFQELDYGDQTTGMTSLVKAVLHFDALPDQYNIKRIALSNLDSEISNYGDPQAKRKLRIDDLRYSAKERNITISYLRNHNFQNKKQSDLGN